MVCNFYKVVCLVTFILFKFVYCQRYVDDFCTLNSTGATGQCQLLDTCTSAIQALQSQGTYPQTCGFEGSHPIVCCSNSVESITTKPTQPTIAFTTARIGISSTRSGISTTRIGSTSTRRPGELGVGEKSNEKCKEFKKYVYKEFKMAAIVDVPGGFLEEECTIANPTVYVANGDAALVKQFPHMALIGYQGQNREKKWLCDGSLISEDFILTAATCLDHQEYGDARFIKIGDLILNSDEDDAQPQEFDIIKTFTHPNYRPSDQYNDIALAKIDKKARLNLYARPACLDTSTNIDFTKKPTGSGWGENKYEHSLLRVPSEYVTPPDCNNAYQLVTKSKPRDGIMGETQICARKTGTACPAYSGGPLQMYNEEVFCMYTIVGVNSFPHGCNGSTIPGIYTRVSHYINWIEGIVWPT